MQKRVAPSNYYVTAAIVAAELYRTLHDCRSINITASNAQAASLAAGQPARGFRALTESIDELARYTTKAATEINCLAVETSKLAAATARSESALKRFQQAKSKAEGAAYADSIGQAITRTEQSYKLMQMEFNQKIAKMRRALDDLHQQLRSATILAAIARIEVSHIDSENRAIFSAVADTIDSAATQIKKRVDYSIGLFNAI